MTFNLKDIVILDIEGKEIKTELEKTIGNIIYYSSKDIGLAEKGKSIYKGEKVELDQEEINKIKELLNNKELSTLTPIALRAVESFLIIK